MNDVTRQIDFNDERLASVCLSLVPGVGPRIFGELIESLGSAVNVLHANESQLQQVSGIGSKLCAEIGQAKNGDRFGELLETCEQNQIKIIDRQHADYPSPLKEIYDPPSLLFTFGDIKPADSIAIAIVGSRHATHYGKKIGEQLGRGLALAGFTIVSGLARGIDAAAHRGALESGGRTIAVLGSGLLNIYPTEHENLAREIIGQGAVVSELHPHQPPQSGAFPQRNRIVTGLSLGVIVVEAAQRSGALISARLAGEQNREVFAVPGRIDSRMSHGCHGLLRDGATLVQSVDDVLEQLGPLAQPTQVDSETTIRHPAELKLTEQETTVLQHIELDPTDIDSLVALTNLPAARVLSTISVLEIRRLVRRVPGNKVLRV